MLFFYFKLNRCGTCRGHYTENDKEPWIACDQCDQWYHGRCQGLTQKDQCSEEQRIHLLNLLGSINIQLHYYFCMYILNKFTFF